MVDVNLEPWMAESSPLLSVKAIFFGHFIFISLSFNIFLPQSYLFSNLTYICLLVWCHVDKNNYETVHLAYWVNLISIPADIIVLAVFFGEITGVFGMIMAVFNLFFRGFSFVVLRKEMFSRGGDVQAASTFGGQYQDIDSDIP